MKNTCKIFDIVLYY